MMDSRLFLLTGNIDAGKTTFCSRFARAARQKNFDVAGVLSPSLVCRQQKVAIEVENIRSGERKTLAQLQPHDTKSPQTDHWFFCADALQWGNEALRQAIPCDLLIVDELGPLEFLRQEGWLAGIEAVESGKYQLGLVVIRPALLQPVKQRWQDAQLITFYPWLRNFQSWFWRKKLLTQLDKGAV